MSNNITKLKAPFAPTTPEQRARKQTAPKSISLQDLLQRNIPERHELLAPWVRTGESTMVWAPTGVGKSWFALSVALAVAGGGTVLGWHAPKPAKVLYIDGEMHLAEVQERMRRLIDGGAIEGIDLEAAVNNLDFHSRQQQELDTIFWDLLKEQDQKLLVELVEREGYSLVIFDNLTVLSDSLDDENSAGAIEPALSLMTKLKAAEVATILVHHANKSGDNYRGSTAIATTFEVIIGLQASNDPREDRRNAAGFTMTFTKSRPKRDDTTASRKAYLVNDAWELEELDDTEATRVVGALRLLRYTTQKEIGEALKMAQYNVSRALSRAVALGKITKDEADDCFRKARELKQGTILTFDEAEF